jgi:pimeloyl-ACP methyl ester carboxylesterase
VKPTHPDQAAALPESLRSGLNEVSVEAAVLRYLRTGAGRSVVLMHTLRTQLEMFAGVLERLDRRRLEAVAVDLPGHGHSTAPRVAYTAEYFSGVIERFLTLIDVEEALLVGESIGGTIALTVAARRNPRVTGVIAINPYDYGRWGGIRRSSPLANALFTAILWPAAGELVARGETRPILRTLLDGGVQDTRVLTPELVEELYRSGKRPGHARALRSLCRSWRSFIAARDRYTDIEVPVTLVYGDHDWSRSAERDANGDSIPGARVVLLEDCGHFASLEQPDAIAELISEFH